MFEKYFRSRKIHFLRPGSTTVFLQSLIQSATLDAFKATLKIEGASPETYFNIGIAYNKLEHYEIALKYFNKATKLDQFYHEAWYEGGVSLSKLDKWYQALHFFNKALHFVL